MDAIHRSQNGVCKVLHPPPPQLNSLRKCNCMILILAVSVLSVNPQKLQRWGKIQLWNHLVAEAAKDLYSSQWCRNSPHLADLLCFLALSQPSGSVIPKLFLKGFPKGRWDYLLLLSLSFIVLLVRVVLFVNKSSMVSISHLKLHKRVDELKNLGIPGWEKL